MPMREAADLMDLIGWIYGIAPALLRGDSRSDVLAMARTTFCLVCEGRGYPRSQAGYALGRDRSMGWAAASSRLPVARLVAQGILTGHLTRSDALAVPQNANAGICSEQGRAA